MLIREWMRRLPHDAAARFASAPPWHVVDGDRDSWALSAANPALVSRAAAALRRETAEALKAVVIRFGSLPFEWEQYEAAAAGAGLPSGVAAREMERLRAAGIVFTVRKTWGDRLFFVASDALAAWMTALLPADVRPLDGGRRSARPLQDYVEPFGLQLLQMLAELGKRGPAPSERGYVAERTASAAASRLAIGPDALRPFEARFAAGVTDPRWAFGLAAALHLGLLGESEGRLAWRREALAAWLAMDAGRRERELLAFAADRLAACDERFAHAAALLRTLEGGVWYPAAGIDAWFARHVPAAGGHWRAWAETLAAFGWMQTGISAEGEPVIRWLIDPREGAETAADGMPACAGLRFMPGAELAVPPELDWRLRWELELIADKTKSGPMTGMRLTAASYARWAGCGRTAEDALSLLEEAAGRPVPDDLASAIREWEESAGRMAFREALLLVCDDKRIADRAAAEPSVAERLGERIGDRHFLIDRRHAADLRRRLAKAGIPAREGIAEGEESARGRYPSMRFPGGLPEESGAAADAPCQEQPGDPCAAKAAGLLAGLRLERYAPDLEIRPPQADAARGAIGGGRNRSASAAAGTGDKIRASGAGERMRSAAGSHERPRDETGADARMPRTDADQHSGAVMRTCAAPDAEGRTRPASAEQRMRSSAVAGERPGAGADADARTQAPSGDPGHPRSLAGSPWLRAVRSTGLPAHWFGAPRRVHPSTRREMVKRAIEIGAAVRIVRDGVQADILPERLEETEGGWRMIGRPAGTAAEQDRIELDGDSWSEMQLLLPDWIGERK